MKKHNRSFPLLRLLAKIFRFKTNILATNPTNLSIVIDVLISFERGGGCKLFLSKKIDWIQPAPLFWLRHN